MKAKGKRSLTPSFWTSPSLQRRTAPRSAGSPCIPPCVLLSACRCSSPLRTGLESRRSPPSAKSRSWTPSSGWWRFGEPRSKGRHSGTWKCSSPRAATESLASPSSSSCVKVGLARGGERSLLWWTGNRLIPNSGQKLIVHYNDISAAPWRDKCWGLSGEDRGAQILEELGGLDTKW